MRTPPLYVFFYEKNISDMQKITSAPPMNDNRNNMKLTYDNTENRMIVHEI